jgi:hypothetical protein
MKPILIPIFALIIAGLWKTFEKANQHGWWSVIPILNAVGIFRVGGQPGSMVWFLLIPIVNLVVLIWIHIEIAKRFGYGVMFGLGLLILPFVFFPILGLGNAKYLPRAT